MKVADVTSMGSDAPQAIPLNLTWKATILLLPRGTIPFGRTPKEKAKSVGGFEPWGI